MLANGHEKAYACKCLNVRIRPQSAPPVESKSAVINVEYTQVYVGDEGISVAHPQLTLRTRSPGIPILGTTRCTRLTSLTCLICHTLVYHVHQVVPLDVEGRDGPLLPTDDWVEQEVMKSANGWIEVHQDCLAGDTIAQAESSKSYSAVFGVVLPSTVSSPSPELPRSPVTRPSSPRPPTHPKSYLSDMRSLFPPPPFTPTHPIFLHLSFVASSKSQALKASAEEYISNAIAEKTKEIEQVEDQLRKQVEALWKAFRDGIDNLEQGTSHRLPLRQKDPENLSEAGRTTSSKRVAVRDFVPVQSHPARTSSASSLPRVSSLSASLATTSFHHPRAVQASSSSPVPLRASSPLSSPSSSSGSRSLYSASGISSLTLRSQAEGTGIIEPFKRNMDQATDTVASFRYFTNLEAEMARAARGKQDTGINMDMVQTSPGVGQGSRGPPQALPSITNGHEKSPRRRRSGSQSNQEVLGEGNSGGAISGPLTNGSKGKRKVTFDIEPDVVTIKREVNAEKEEEAAEASRGAGDLMFDIEDEGSERSLSGSATRPVLPLIESHVRASRPRPNRRLGSTTGLPESFSSLRPTSLPVPSYVRSPRGINTSSELIRASQAPQLVADSIRHPSLGPESEIHKEPESLDPREAEILKLVAADTPSHRGAWTRDSKAWQLFVRRQDDKSGYPNIIPEEFENGDDLAVGRDNYGDSDSDDDGELGAHNGASPLVGSLPIDINPLSRPVPSLSLASYQPEAPISNRSELVSPRVFSTAALRKAAYAQRDRTRSMDPGALDFDAGVDGDDNTDESDGEAAKSAAVDTGGRGRKLALKILQARSELPAPGMWRSLA